MTAKTGTERTALYRMRQLHERLTDEQYEAAVELARATQTPLTRARLLNFAATGTVDPPALRPAPEDRHTTVTVECPQCGGVFDVETP